VELELGQLTRLEFAYCKAIDRDDNGLAIAHSRTIDD
jgi:hypothetical protein